MDWIIKRLKEPSTLRGIALLLGVMGIKVAPELQEAIILAIGAVIGVIELVRAEKKPAATVNAPEPQPEPGVLLD